MRAALKAILFGTANPTISVDFAGGFYQLGGQRFSDPTQIPGWSFTRASVGYGQNSAGLLIPFASGAPRIVPGSGILIEESKVNKNTNYNLNPPNTTNLSGGGAALTTVVDDSAALAAIGLTGNAFKVDNSGGGSNVFVNIGGTTGNTNPHSFSVYWRGGNGAVDAVNSAPQSVTGTASYVRVKQENQTPGSAAGFSYIRVDAGQTVYFVLNDLEEGTFCTSPIVTAGASATRAADVGYIDGVYPPVFTLYAEADLPANDAAGNKHLSNISVGGSNANRAYIYRSLAGAAAFGEVTGGVLTDIGAISSGTSGAIRLRGALSYDGTTYRTAAQGLPVASLVAAPMVGQISRLSLGTRADGVLFLNGYDRKLVVYPFAMSTAQMQGITA